MQSLNNMKYKGGGGQEFAKFADGREVGVKNREKFADVLNGWSLLS